MALMSLRPKQGFGIEALGGQKIALVLVLKNFLVLKN